MIQIFLAFCTAFSLPTSLRLITMSGSEWNKVVLEHRITDFIQKVADILIDGTKILVDTKHGMETLENGAGKWRILRQLEIMEGDIKGQIVFSQKQHNLERLRAELEEAELKEMFQELQDIFGRTEGLEEYIALVKRTYGDGIMDGFRGEPSSKEEAEAFMRQKLITMISMPCR